MKKYYLFIVLFCAFSLKSSFMNSDVQEEIDKRGIKAQVILSIPYDMVTIKAFSTVASREQDEAAIRKLVQDMSKKYLNITFLVIGTNELFADLFCFTIIETPSNGFTLYL